MIDPALLLMVLASGLVTGCLGALVGIGGGVFLVPFLTLALGLPIRTAVGVSLLGVIATSCAVSSGRSGRGLINLRLGMLLEVATAAGGLLGGVTSYLLPERAIGVIFSIVTAACGVLMVARVGKRNVIFDLGVDPGRLGGRYFEEESDREVVYRVRRLPVGLLVSFLAGNVSSLLGIGGGILKVPALTAWCGVPMRAAAATSAFMIGVTAVAAAPIYYARGEVVPPLAAAAVLGVLGGSRAGLWLGPRAAVRSLKILLAVILFAVSALMLLRAR